MAVLRLRRDITAPPPFGAGGPPTVRVRDWDEGTDASAVERLAATGAMGGLRAAGFRGELRSRPGRAVRAWVAEACDTGSVVGIVSLVAAGPERRWSIGWLLVAAAERRRGVAAALVRTALQAAGSAGAREVWVETDSRWTAAVAFWQRVGFAAARRSHGGAAG